MISILLSVPLPAVVDCGDRGTSQNCVSIFSRSDHMTNSGEGGKDGRGADVRGRTGGGADLVKQNRQSSDSWAIAVTVWGGRLARVVCYDS